MVAKKRKSKRQTLQTKFKIVKRTKEHHKRLKKGRIDGPGKGKKNPDRIPNAWPYKEEVSIISATLTISNLNPMICVLGIPS
jgi:nuclear GTP-binding protein